MKMNNYLPFAGKAPTGYVEVTGTFNPEYEYAIISIDGNCLDSDLSPKRIRHNDKILIHAIQITTDEIRKAVNKIVCILLTDGQFISKQIYLFDWIGKSIGIRFFNPIEEHFYIPVSKIKSLFVVDDVYCPESIKRVS